jgi:hypothetical protein
MKKRKLSNDEEFQIMKLVLDKFLWIGTLVMLYGGYVSLTQTLTEGAYYIGAGAIILILFALFIIKEFEQLR